MANLKVLDGDGNDKYLGATGAGTDPDPHINIHEMRTDLSAWQTFTIGNGADGSAVAPADLGANYKAIIIRCADCQYIPATTTMGLELSEDAADTMCDMYEANDPGTIWVSDNLPTTGTLRVVITHAFMARRVRIVLSGNSTGGATTFAIAGSDRGL